MSVAQIKSLNDKIVELGYHSYAHQNYKTQMSIEDVHEDFNKCHEFINKHQIKVNNVLAYPYGKYPRKAYNKSNFFNELQAQNIIYGLRIGNRVNRFPFKNNYEVQRIDIKGEDDLKKFKLKLKYGKLKLF